MLVGLFYNEAEIQAVGHTVGHRQQLTVSVSVQNCWKCLYIDYSWIRSRASIPSPAPNLQYKEVNRLRIVLRDLARIIRVPNWAFVTTNVTVRLKW